MFSSMWLVTSCMRPARYLTVAVSCAAAMWLRPPSASAAVSLVGPAVQYALPGAFTAGEVLSLVAVARLAAGQLLAAPRGSVDLSVACTRAISHSTASLAAAAVALFAGVAALLVAGASRASVGLARPARVLAPLAALGVGACAFAVWLSTITGCLPIAW